MNPYYQPYQNVGRNMMLQSQQQLSQASPYNYYNQMIPQYVEQAQTQIGIKGRPVSSLDEARAMSIDFDGSIFYFPDLANKRIYTKQINPDGTSTFNVYELQDIPLDASPTINDKQFVTREEFEQTLLQIQNALLQQQQMQQTQQQQQILTTEEADVKKNEVTKQEVPKQIESQSQNFSSSMKF